ncbi:hypothetical protein Pfo_028444 [Paulownia fortunei]|nr:hypothetical protein Pfo_028444 [Paulownia fortunei]
MDDELPKGFRFYPTEEELVSFYLHNKLNGTRPVIDRIIPVLDIYDYNPWDLPQLGGEHCPADGEQWFFFIPRQKKRKPAEEGLTGLLLGVTESNWLSGRCLSSQNRVIGRKRTMVFYVGRAPSGRKTVWKMNEYKAIESDEASSSSTAANPQLREELSLCRIYKRSKCLRAFDRRPPSEAVHHHHLRHEAATFNNIQHNPIVPEIADCSLDSSSSGDHITNPSTSVESMVTDNEPFWDWEQLDWSDV